MPEFSLVVCDADVKFVMSLYLPITKLFLQGAFVCSPNATAFIPDTSVVSPNDNPRSAESYVIVLTPYANEFGPNTLLPNPIAVPVPPDVPADASIRFPCPIATPLARATLSAPNT